MKESVLGLVLQGALDCAEMKPLGSWQLWFCEERAGFHVSLFFYFCLARPLDLWIGFL